MNNNASKTRLVMNAIENILKNSGVKNLKIVPFEEFPDTTANHQDPNDIDLTTCKEVERAVPKNIPAITFDNSCIYTTDGVAEVPNDVRTIFCNMAYNNTRDIIGENNDFDTPIGATVDFTVRNNLYFNCEIVKKNIYNYFLQEYYNLCYSLINSVNELLLNLKCDPIKTDIYEITFGSPYNFDFNNMLENIFVNTPQVATNIINSGRLDSYIATMVNAVGADTYNNFINKYIMRVVSGMDTKTAETFMKGFNTLFRMFMGDLSYTGAVLTATIANEVNASNIYTVFNANSKANDILYKKEGINKDYIDE